MVLLEFYWLSYLKLSLCRCTFTIHTCKCLCFFYFSKYCFNFILIYFLHHFGCAQSNCFIEQCCGVVHANWLSVREWTEAVDSDLCLLQPIYVQHLSQLCGLRRLFVSSVALAKGQRGYMKTKSQKIAFDLSKIVPLCCPEKEST